MTCLKGLVPRHSTGPCIQNTTKMNFTDWNSTWLQEVASSQGMFSSLVGTGGSSASSSAASSPVAAASSAVLSGASSVELPGAAVWDLYANYSDYTDGPWSLHQTLEGLNNLTEWPTSATSDPRGVGTGGDGRGGQGSGGGKPYTDKPWNLLRQSIPMVIILSFAYVVVFILAIVNNSLVVAVIYRNPQLRTVTNYFIANLAVADIFVSLIVLPITLQSNLFEEWWLGPILCKAAPFLQGVVVSSSVNTLAAVAVERYLAIFYPRTNRMTPKIAAIIITFIWLVPMCIFVPWAIVYQQKELPIRGFKYVTCMPVWDSLANQKGYTLGAVFLTCYLIPLVFIAIFYLLIGIRVWKRKVAGMRGTRVERNIQRSKIRIVRMLLVVFVVFAILWLPLYSFKVRVLFGPVMRSMEKVIMRRYLVPLAQWLGAANSCVNPFIYCYFSANFRKSIIAVIRSKSCCSKISL